MLVLRILVFLCIVLSTLTLGHLYLWRRLVRDPQWPLAVRRVLTALLVALPVGLVLHGIFRRIQGTGAPTLLKKGLYSWLGVAFLLLCLLALAEVWKTLPRVWRRLRSQDESPPDPPASPERRVLLARSIAGAAGAISVTSSAFGIRSAHGEITTPEVVVPMARLPKALTGLSIIQLTDIHIGSTMGQPFLEQVVAKTNALRGDAIVITGDLVDGKVPHIGSLLAPLAKLRSRYGTYFVTGNHEYYSGAPEWIEHLAKLGVRTLGNERVELGDKSPGGASLDLAGIHDFQGRRISGHTPDLEGALAGRDPERSLVLLAHQPKAIRMATKAGVELMISGHTHGGQIWPFGALVQLAQPFVAGLHRADDTMVYVSRGTGVWGPPMRIMAPAEITKIVLTT